MFVPLYDTNRLKHIRFQFITLLIVILNIAIFSLTYVAAAEVEAQKAILGYGYIPAVMFDHARLSPDLVRLPDYATLFSYAFLHAGWWHLLGNMMFLWVFGDNVEDALGHFRFVLFYLIAISVPALLHGLVVQDSKAPLIGASGAVSAVVGAYLMLHPKIWVWVLMLGRFPVKLPAALILLGWVGLQVYSFLADTTGEVAWDVHIAGIVCGIIMVVVLKRRNVALFDRDLPSGPVETPPQVDEAAETQQSESSPKWGRNEHG